MSPIRLAENDLLDALDALGGSWERKGETIVNQYKFENFRAALAFVDRVGEAAEEADHHPDILIHGYNKVRLTLTTHSAGGVTEADFSLARQIDALAR